MTMPEPLLESHEGPFDPLGRAVRIAEVADRLESCLNDLDRLDQWEAGAHLSMAIAALERHLRTFNYPRCEKMAHLPRDMG